MKNSSCLELQVEFLDTSKKLNPISPAEENIQRICFEKEGFLCSEFDDIFSDLFSHKSPRYKEIV